MKPTATTLATLALSAVVVLSNLACSGSNGAGGGSASGGGTSSGGGSGSGGGTSSGTKDLGGFTVRINPALPGTDAGYVTVQGKVYDGPVPSLVQWETAGTSGDCSLIKPKTPLCSPGCTGGAVCVATNTCLANPTLKSVGAASVSGVKTSTGATMFNLMESSKNYLEGALELPMPAFAEGGAISITAAGNELPGFTLAAKGVAELYLNNATIPVKSGMPIALTWPAAQASTGSKVHVELDISHHGGTKGKIVCDANDTGSVTLAANLVGDLLALGVAGFPSISVARSTVGTATITQGTVKLTVVSEVKKEVTIDGLESCSTDDDCTMPKKCQPDLTCK